VLFGQAKQDAVGANPELSARICGAYELAPGWIIAVGSEDSDLVYQDFQSGHLGLLHRSDETVFTAGFTILSTTPVRSTFRFIEDSTKRVTGLVIEQKGQPTRTAIKLNFLKGSSKVS